MSRVTRTATALAAAAVGVALAVKYRFHLAMLGLWPPAMPLERDHAQEVEEVQRRLRERR